MQPPLKLTFVHMTGCPACEKAKPHLRKWHAENAQYVQLEEVDLVKDPWPHAWQPEVTPTYILSMRGKQPVQYQGMMTKAELPRFVASAYRVWGMR